MPMKKLELELVEIHSHVNIIGLLEGQQSKAEDEPYDKQLNPDKVASRAFAENRDSEITSTNVTCASN